MVPITKPKLVRAVPALVKSDKLFAGIKAVIVKVETAVINPLALTVITGTKVAEPNVPTFPLTVAKVPVMAVVPEPVKSPDNVMDWFVVR